MSFQFDPEAKVAIAAALNEVEELLERDIPNSVALVCDTAKDVGTQQVISTAAAYETSLNGLTKLLKQLIGQPTDKSADGTVYGALNWATAQAEQ